MVRYEMAYRLGSLFVVGVAFGSYAVVHGVRDDRPALVVFGIALLRAMDTHGALGRLLVWDETRRWWITQEPDLELVITCAPSDMFSEESEKPSWLSLGADASRQKADELRVRYGVTWAD